MQANPALANPALGMPTPAAPAVPEAPIEYPNFVLKVLDSPYFWAAAAVIGVTYTVLKKEKVCAERRAMRAKMSEMDSYSHKIMGSSVVCEFSTLKPKQAQPIDMQGPGPAKSIMKKYSLHLNDNQTFSSVISIPTVLVDDKTDQHKVIGEAPVYDLTSALQHACMPKGAAAGDKMAVMKVLQETQLINQEETKDGSFFVVTEFAGNVTVNFYKKTKFESDRGFRCVAYVQQTIVCPRAFLKIASDLARSLTASNAQLMMDPNAQAFAIPSAAAGAGAGAGALEAK